MPRRAGSKWHCVCLLGAGMAAASAPHVRVWVVGNLLLKQYAVTAGAASGSTTGIGASTVVEVSTRRSALP